jgi:signal transduction histidine kinase
MGKLVGDLLYLAKTDNVEIGMDSLPFNISDTVRDTVLSMEAVVYEKGLMLTQHIEPDIIINGDSDKLAQVVKILIDNAIKYSNKNGSIDIALEQTKQQVVFTIKNTGDGISSEQLPKLFDRFYRIDSSRTHDGSYGLGLSIAKAIIDSIGGKIYATSVEGESSTFVFLLNK